MSCCSFFIESIEAEETLPEIVRFKLFSRIKVLGIFKLRSSLVPSRTLFFILITASWELILESLVFSLKLSPLASHPETNAGRIRLKERSFFNALDGPLIEGIFFGCIILVLMKNFHSLNVLFGSFNDIFIIKF